MAEDRTLRAIAWQEAFPALRLFEALRLALGFRPLLLAAAALVLNSAGWWVCGELFSQSSDEALAAQINANSVWPWQRSLRPLDTIETGAMGGRWIEPADMPPQFVAPEWFVSFERWQTQSPLVIAWKEITAPFRRMYADGISFTHFMYLLLCALWSLAVWSLFGGAISRQAAVTFAHRENVSWRQLAAFLVPRWGSYFAAPMFPILGTFLGALVLAIPGLLMRFGPGLLVIGLLWPLILVGGFLMAFLLIGLFFGWPLMWAAVSAEGTDAFGALSHSYSYVYQRPLQYLLYAFVAALTGLLGWYLVSLFAFWIVDLSNWGVSWTASAQRIAEISLHHDLDSRTGEWGAGLVRFWNECVFMLALAYVFSYLWTSTTVIYFLLRRLVDAVELDEVFRPDEPNQYGLPPLKTGPDGVPEVADDPPHSPAGGSAGPATA